MFSIMRHARSILQRTYFNSPRLLTARNYSPFDEDGDPCGMRTTVSMLNNQMDGLGIDGFSQLGFLLNNGLRVFGPCAIFPRSILQWNVRDVEDISEESLSLFTMLDPKLDILVIGVGDYEDVRKLNKNVIKHLSEHKISAEVLATEHAVATFNFLCEEKRYVAGAFIPPTKVEGAADEIYLTDSDRTPERDMLIVMHRMAKLKGENFEKLPDATDDKNQQ